MRPRGLALLCGLLVALPGCYATRMALHHNDLFNSRRPLSEVVADPATPPEIRAKLEQTQAIVAYAQAAGLATAGAYRYFIQTEEPVVSYIVQAAHPDRLKFVTWWFPVVGDVPYLGFFSKSERDAKADELRAQGYDVHTGGAGAFSSLGWFEDPIFSSMLRRDEPELAHLFFHELTHRTLWVPGSTEFNENLAEYAGSYLTKAYLRDIGRQDLLPTYESRLNDRLLFRQWLTRLRAALKELYARRQSLSREPLLAEKAIIFEEYQRPPLKPQFAAVDYVAPVTWNNASVLGAALYAPDLERFAKAHQCVRGGALRDFLAALEDRLHHIDKKIAAKERGFAALDGLCDSADSLF